MSINNPIISVIDKGARDSYAMDEIAEILSDGEWNSDTLMYVAEVVQRTGREIKDVNEEAEDEE